MDKRILEITGEPIGTGGQEMFVINVIRHIKHDGLHIDWLTPYFCDNKVYEKDVVQNGGTVYCLNIPFRPGKIRSNIILPLNNFFKHHQYDVVHIHSGSISVLVICSILARLYGIKKIIVHSHCAGLKKSFKYRVLKFFSNPLIKIFPTDYCACSKLAGQWKYPNSIVNGKLKILKNGVDLEAFLPQESIRNTIRNMYHIKPSTFLLGHVGRFSTQKNQEFVIRVLARLKDIMKDCKLMFIGEGENIDEAKDLVEKLLLNEYVIFVGSVHNVNDYLQAMDVFVLPSRWEGLPIVGIEAQAAGLPVLVSDKVTKEMKLVKNVSFLPIDDEKVWVSTLLNTDIVKIDNREQMRKAGYDINDTADIVRDIYMS